MAPTLLRYSWLTSNPLPVQPIIRHAVELQNVGRKAQHLILT